MPYNRILKEKRDFCRCQIIKSLRISNSYKKVIFLKISNIHSSNCQTFLARLAKLLQDCVFRNYIRTSEDFTPAAKPIKKLFQVTSEEYPRATSELHQLYFSGTSMQESIIIPFRSPRHFSEIIIQNRVMRLLT